MKKQLKLYITQVYDRTYHVSDDNYDYTQLEGGSKEVGHGFTAREALQEYIENAKESGSFEEYDEYILSKESLKYFGIPE